MASTLGRTPSTSSASTVRASWCCTASSDVIDCSSTSRTRLQRLFFAAWLGLTPREYSTGGKTTLLGISKRGNTYLRRILIHGARSCLLHLHRDRDRLGAWLSGLEKRTHRNKVVTALANKIARIAWALLAHPE